MEPWDENLLGSSEYRERVGVPVGTGGDAVMEALFWPLTHISLEELQRTL